MQYEPPISLAEDFYAGGITDLISVIPPGATLAPTSKIDPSQLGKIPGRKLPNGLYAGYSWRKHEATLDDVRRWCLDGANIGLRTDRFPAVDIDCLDDGMSQAIQDIAVAKLGAAPLRVGRWPKRLLAYRTAEPFGRMRLWFSSRNHLIEILGQGQQYVALGTHPGTKRAYEWRDVPAGGLTADGLTVITREQAAAFLAEVKDIFERLGVDCELEGDGRPVTHVAAANQQGLVAPSMEALREAVSLIPNTDLTHPTRDDYIRLGYAIRAACGDDEGEGQEIFMRWAAKWPGNARFPKGNDPETVLSDWCRFKGPYSVGWKYVAETARQYGFNDAALEFDVSESQPSAEESDIEAQEYSDQWLADEVITRRGPTLRFVPAHERFFVWTGSRWEPDISLLGDNIIALELRRIADRVARRGATAKERANNAKRARAMCSAGKLKAVKTLLQNDRAIVVEPDALDQDPWLLNTPAGICDLRTGALGGFDPAQLCTKRTSVAPDFTASCPTWKRFLAEATGGDVEMECYLQRLAGYCLTGVTREQTFTFVWGPGGNGKSVFVNTLRGIQGDYARTAPMDTFTASNHERHSTELAMLQGARLVTASETQAGKRWDEARVKSLTGSDPVTARFMRQDFFTYTPQFKLLFTGNHKPALRTVDDAMKRRVHLVPFVVKPVSVDRNLEEKLRGEWPGILAWTIDGCLAWQRAGLNPPKAVTATTDEYFREEDAVGQWLDEACTESEAAFTQLKDLFASWREWCGGLGNAAGTDRQLSQALRNRGLEPGKHPDTRRTGYHGIILLPKIPEPLKPVNGPHALDT